MCTAISVTSENHYFGRNLDLEHSFGEKVVITPRNFEFCFTNEDKLMSHFAIIGMALPYDGYPLYFDAVNEHGLAMAGLNFPQNACYNKAIDGKSNIASFEIIPWVLCNCKNIKDAEALLEKANITDTAFNDKMPPSPLHWIISDKEKSLTVEQTFDGLHIYDNPVGVLTNNPTFDIHMFGLRNFQHLSPKDPINTAFGGIELPLYCKGMGAIGLPGDMSSMSRFVKASFTKMNAVFDDTEEKRVAQFFHLLESVFQTKGTVCTDDGYEMTLYSSCCNTDNGIYYYKTYYNSRINAVSMYNENLEGSTLYTFDINIKDSIQYQN